MSKGDQRRNPRSDRTITPLTNEAARTEQAIRQRAEEALQQVPLAPADGDALSPTASRQALHELRLHQIELEMQNEELRAAQLELEAARARYFEIYDLAPVGYCSVSQTGLILDQPYRCHPAGGRPRGAGHAAVQPLHPQWRPGRLLPPSSASACQRPAAALRSVSAEI